MKKFLYSFLVAGFVLGGLSLSQTFAKEGMDKPQKEPGKMQEMKKGVFQNFKDAKWGEFRSEVKELAEARKESLKEPRKDLK